MTSISSPLTTGSTPLSALETNRTPQNPLDNRVNQIAQTSFSSSSSVSSSSTSSQQRSQFGDGFAAKDIYGFIRFISVNFISNDYKKHQTILEHLVKCILCNKSLFYTEVQAFYRSEPAIQKIIIKFVKHASLDTNANVLSQFKIFNELISSQSSKTPPPIIKNIDSLDIDQISLFIGTLPEIDSRNFYIKTIVESVAAYANLPYKSHPDYESLLPEHKKIVDDYMIRASLDTVENTLKRLTEFRDKKEINEEKKSPISQTNHSNKDSTDQSNSSSFNKSID